MTVLRTLWLTVGSVAAVGFGLYGIQSIRHGQIAVGGLLVGGALILLLTNAVTYHFLRTTKTVKI
jgi:hypothetical protein